MCMVPFFLKLWPLTLQHSHTTPHIYTVTEPPTQVIQDTSDLEGTTLTRELECGILGWNIFIHICYTHVCEVIHGMHTHGDLKLWKVRFIITFDLGPLCSYLDHKLLYAA